MKAANGGKMVRGSDEPIAKQEGEASEEEELPTELALGSDGRLYVNAEGVDPEKIKGRTRFVGFAMTDEEAATAVGLIHQTAFNVTVAAVPLWRKPQRR